jgi:hypothetical protein
MVKNIVIRMLDKIRTEKSKPSLKDLVSQQMQKKNEKDERARIRIKEQVLEIYEDKNGQQYAEENDPNFTKIIVHIERVLKITTAQTLAIDSLERKIANLSKRKLQSTNRDMIVPEQDEKVKNIIKSGITDQYVKSTIAIEERKLQVDDPTRMKKQRDEVIKEKFPNLYEDDFHSSDDEAEQKRNQRMEKLGMIANNMVEDVESPEQPKEDPKQTSPVKKEFKVDKVTIGDQGDIISKYKFSNQQKMDPSLALPEESDSSQFSSDNEKKPSGSAFEKSNKKPHENNDKEK